MDEEEFEQLLNLLVLRGNITPAESAVLLGQYQAGEIPPQALPLPLESMDVGYVPIAPPPTSTTQLTSLRDEIERQLALIASGDVNAQEWEEQVLPLILAYSEATSLDAQAQQQMLDYFYLFAGSVAVYALLGRPFTGPQITARAISYLGFGWGAWFRNQELGFGRGQLIDYIARDDLGTCGPCSTAQAGGPYKPGEGPFPGEVCLGRGACRCIRRPRRA